MYLFSPGQRKQGQWMNHDRIATRGPAIGSASWLHKLTCVEAPIRRNREAPAGKHSAWHEANCATFSKHARSQSIF